MKNSVIDFLDGARSAKSLKQLETLYTKTLSNLGFRQWAYQVVRAEALADERPVILTTFPEAWYQHYTKSSYNLIDPVVIHGPKQVIPFLWSSMSFGFKPSADQTRLFSEAAEFGLAEGLGVPIHGAQGSFAMASMVSDVPTAELQRLLSSYGDVVHLASLAFHSHARDHLALGRSGQEDVDLSRREREVLLWTARGKTRSEIGDILGLSHRTVEFYLLNARNKLGTANSLETVLRAVMLKKIQP